MYNEQMLPDPAKTSLFIKFQKKLPNSAPVELPTDTSEDFIILFKSRIKWKREPQLNATCTIIKKKKHSDPAVTVNDKGYNLSSNVSQILNLVQCRLISTVLITDR